MSTKSVLRPPGATLGPRKVSLTDRIALRVGVALIIWSRRTRRVRPPVDPALVAELERKRIARETEWAVFGIGLRTWR